MPVIYSAEFVNLESLYKLTPFGNPEAFWESLDSTDCARNRICHYDIKLRNPGLAS